MSIYMYLYGLRGEVDHYNDRAGLCAAVWLQVLSAGLGSVVGVAQWLGRRSLAGGFFLISDRSVG